MDLPPTPETNAGLLSLIEAEWSRLHALVAGLAEAQLVAPLRDWSVKDHLAHLTAWERCATAALQGHAFYDGLQLASPPPAVTDFDAINALLHERAIDYSLVEVLAASHAGHERMLTMLGNVGYNGLMTSFASPGISQGRTLIEVVANNTCLHYFEHRFWLEEQLAERDA